MAEKIDTRRPNVTDMEEPSDRNDDSLGECETLHHVLSQIPKKAQSGILKTCHLILTCIDANEEYIAIGANIGLVFLFNREDNTMQRLRTNNSEDVITSTRLHSGIDLQIAIGTASGNVYIFCIPGKLSVLKRNQVHKFDVIDVHKHYITCIEWSTNGMKVFTGDQAGHIVTTEVDFQESQCTSSLLLVEPGIEIVQLDYNHKSLLVSTKQNSFIVRFDKKCMTIFIGTQNHKMSGTFGACFIPGLCKTDDALLYTARAGCRIWCSDMTGSVRNTLIFSSPLSPAVTEISLMQAGKLQLDTQEFQFGKLKFFRDGQLVTWSNMAIVVLDPTGNKVVAQQSRLNGITDVAVVKTGEIFVLRKHAEARIIRISNKPEKKKERVEISLSVAKEKTAETRPEEDNLAKSFFKKAFATPLKKIDNFMNEAKPQTADVPLDDFPEVSSALQSPAVEVKINGKPVPSEHSEVIIPPFMEENLVAKETAEPENQDTADGKIESGDEIVFSHKMKRKHKKPNKREKAGQKLAVRKDEDSVSINSGTSELSDDFPVIPQTPQNTPAAQDSPLYALQRADDMLRLVKNILDKDNDNQPDIKEVKPVMALEDLANEFIPPVSSTVLERDDAIIEESENGKKEENVGALDGEEMHSHTTNNNTKNNIENSDEILEQTMSRCELHTNQNGPRQIEESLSTEMDICENLPSNNFQSSEIETKTDNFTTVTVDIVNRIGDEKVSENTVSSMDINSDLHAIESSDPFDKRLSKEPSVDDDFYSQYIQNSTGFLEESTLETVVPKLNYIPQQTDSETKTKVAEDINPPVLVNSWSEFTTPTNIYSLSMSNNHIWFTDKSENIHYSSLGGAQGIVWRKATGQANQISVSPNGNIVWRLHKNTVFAGTKISSRYPEGLKWVEAIREVACIAVDDNCAWFLKCSGEVMMQRGLSLERPFFKSKKVECNHQLVHIHCHYGIVLAITKEMKLLIRTGITSDFPEGLDWKLYISEQPPYLFSNIAIDHEKICWAIDALGQIWFSDQVMGELQIENMHWWQVPLSEYVMQDESTMDVIKSLVYKFDPLKLARVAMANKGGLVAGSTQGIGLSLNFKNTLHLCRGSVLGYQWLCGQPSQLSPLSTWKLVCAKASHLEHGYIWIHHTNGDTYVFKRPNSEAKQLEDTVHFSCISTSSDSVWALTPSGDIQVRLGVTALFPEGTKWIDLDLSQLGDGHLVHLSCNSSFVWAVESRGLIYQRIGVKPQNESGLNPVWLPIDSFSEIVFTQIHTGPLDWMVWAIDNRRLIYMRAGITEMMPIGSEWIHVSGIPAVDLVVTNSGVWALSPSGEIYFRHGITRTRMYGNYWKKIPGTFTKISASDNDDLWAINSKGQLMYCNSKYIIRHQDSSDPLLLRHSSTGSSFSEETEWEIV